VFQSGQFGQVRYGTTKALLFPRRWKVAAEEKGDATDS
jgi:hypothetical protein